VEAADARLEQIWQIGKQDNSTLEFKSDWDFSQAKDPSFVVGESRAQQDWSGFHPGSLDSASGRRVHPFTIIFSLDQVPKGTFHLTVNAMFKASRVPQYLVEINGRKGKFYFHPKPSYEIGDPDFGSNVIFSTERLEIVLPATYFRQGENRLVLSCVDDSSDTVLAPDVADNATSGIYYDALALTNDPDARFNEMEVTAKALPTILYRSQGTGSLSEVVVIEARAARQLKAGSASLFMVDRRFTCPLTSEYDFGEVQCALDIPEFAAATRARMEIVAGDQTRSYRFSLTPQKKFKLFLVPQTHFDPGYTDYRPNSYEVHARSLDYIIQELESHPLYRFTPDGSWLFKDYWAHRDERWQQRLIALLQQQRIGLPAQLFNVNSGLLSQEELNRLAYFSEEMRSQYGIALDSASLCDVPAHTWALPSYLHDIGVKYLVVGSDQYRAPIIIHGRLNEKSPFWWEGPDGGKILTWYSYHYHQMSTLFGTPASLSAGVDSLPIFLQEYASPYLPDAVMIYGTQPDNVPFDARSIEVADAWNKEFAYPKITVANIGEFFKYVEQNFGPSFATLRGDGGASWEEMAYANAYYSAVARQAKARVISAETLASLGVIVNQDFRFPLAEDHELWSNLFLYAEHVWGHAREWAHPESDLGRSLQGAKQSFSIDAAKQVDDMLQRGFDQLQSRLDARGDLVVLFNPLSWPRTGLVEVEIPRGRGLTDLKTQQPVQLELLRRVDDEDYDRVRFLAQDVQALGYRSYAVTAPSSARSAEELSASTGGVIENAFYKIVVDPARGGISSIYDKQLRRELVDQASPYAMDQYVYVGYGHEDATLIAQHTTYNSSLLQYSMALPRADLKLERAGQLKVAAIKKTPWGTALFIDTSAVHTPHIGIEVRLFDTEKRLEFINTVHKDTVRAPEAAYFAFPFASHSPTIRHDIQNGWVDPTRDQLPGANKEWFAAQHWIAVTNAQATVTLGVNEAPLFTIGDVVRGFWPTTLTVRGGTVFSYVMNNYDGDDDRAYQGGDFTFHYVIRSDRKFDPTALTRMGLETSVPLEVDASPLKVTRSGSPPEPLRPAEGSFLQIASPEIVLSAWKGAENGNGYILRFYNTSDRPVTGEIQFPDLEFDSLNRTNAVEKDEEVIASQDGRINLPLGPHQIYSLRIKGLRLRQGVVD
jgi:alpha-mannosidase